MAYPENKYSVFGAAMDFPEYQSVTGTTLLAKNQDGNWGYISASNLQTTLDGAGLATDASVTAVSASVATVVTMLGVSGSSATQAKFFSTDNGNGTNYKVGDDGWIGDVNASNVIQVSGVQDATKGFIKFGSGSNTPTLGYSGSNAHISLNSALALAPQATLGSAPTGSLAVSGSHLYFFNGTWTQIV
jgi:hypothetical protein